MLVSEVLGKMFIQDPQKDLLDLMLKKHMDDGQGLVVVGCTGFQKCSFQGVN